MVYSTGTAREFARSTLQGYRLRPGLEKLENHSKKEFHRIGFGRLSRIGREVGTERYRVPTVVERNSVLENSRMAMGRGLHLDVFLCFTFSFTLQRSGLRRSRNTYTFTYDTATYEPRSSIERNTRPHTSLERRERPERSEGEQEGFKSQDFSD